MTHTGQIVEIPKQAEVYKKPVTSFASLETELKFKSEPLPYSLFDGFLVGEHYGLDEFNLGQRKGINVGGKDKPLYVIAKNLEHNQLFVGAGLDHPGLEREVIRVSKAKVQWSPHFSISEINQLHGHRVELFFGEEESMHLADFFFFEDDIYFKFQQRIHLSMINQRAKVFFKDQKILEFN